ncbi:MAG: sodium-dependent transporter [Planctomycetaceae bacterium]
MSSLILPKQLDTIPAADGKAAARGGFATNLGFILAAAGSAVGLGNIWKFPYITGVYGGGAFVLVYLGCILLIGLPLMYAELIIGRRGGKDVLGALRSLTESKGITGKAVSYLTGFLSIASGFLILSFYAVVAGWAIHFLAVSLGMIPGAELGATGVFAEVAGSPLMSSVWHTAFMVLTIVVVVAGVHGGIERICKILMPMLVAILIGLLVYVGLTGGLDQSLTFLFKPDFSKLTGQAVLEALGHAFFTLSLGMGAMITYGSYLKNEKHVIRDGVAVAILDTVIALMAGAVIFAVVFSGGMKADAGPGLLFVTLPQLFVTMPGGTIVSVLFFTLVIFAAWSSAVSLLEVVVAYLVDECRLNRRTATWVIGGAIWAVGLLSAWSGKVLGFLDDLTTMYMLPLGGLLIAIAAGWMLTKKDRESGFATLAKSGGFLAASWTITIRFVTPVLVVIVILAKAGLIQL